MAEDRVAVNQRIKAANDIVDVVGGIRQLAPVGAKFVGLCPFHDDHHPSFSVDPRWQNYRCWSCGKFGDVFTFVQEHEKVSFPEARRTAGAAGGNNFRKNRRFSAKCRPRLYVRCYEMGSGTVPALPARQRGGRASPRLPGSAPAHRRHCAPLPAGLRSRRRQLAGATGREANLSSEILEQVGLIAKRSEGPGYYDRFRDRVMFPIRDARGHVVGFGGRILPSSPLAARAAKYYNTTETALFSKSSNLYGIDQARQAVPKRATWPSSKDTPTC